MCSTPTPYLKDEVLPLQAKEVSINMPVRRKKKLKLRPKQTGLSKKSKAQRLRRLREKLALTNSDSNVVIISRQKHLATQSVSDTKDVKTELQEIVNDPLHIISQDTNTTQEISNPVQASCTTTGYQCNSTEKADVSQPLCNSNETQKAIPEKTSVHGRRIIDVDYFFNMLKLMNQHSKSGCNLNDVIITNERKSGLSTVYCLKCTVCDFENVIWSECPTKERNINTDAIAGMLSIDCNFWSMNKLLFKMGLPPLSRTDFAKERHKISPDEVRREIEIIDPNSNFTVIESPNNLGESSELRPQTVVCEASILSNKSYQKNSKEFKENLVLKQKPVIEQVDVCYSSDGSENCEQCYLNKLLVAGEIEDRRDERYEDESENMLAEVLDLRTSKATDDLVIDQRQL